MIRMIGVAVVLGTIAFLAPQNVTLGEDYAIDWYTIDGGGAMFSTGGEYELSGTIGQPDAGTMYGDIFAREGGFWVAGIGQMSIVSSDPPNDAIDARRPSDPDCENVAGWDQVTLLFDCSATQLTADDFAIETIPPGEAPGILEVISDGANATALFDSTIPAGAWTVLTHLESGTSTRIGYLPADVNSSRMSNSQDLLDLIDHLNGVVDYPEWSTDCDRS